jgi:hypothetical protein
MDSSDNITFTKNMIVVKKLETEQLWQQELSQALCQYTSDYTLLQSFFTGQNLEECGLSEPLNGGEGHKDALLTCTNLPAILLVITR